MEYMSEDILKSLSESQCSNFESLCSSQLLSLVYMKDAISPLCHSCANIGGAWFAVFELFSTIYLYYYTCFLDSWCLGVHFGNTLVHIFLLLTSVLESKGKHVRNRMIHRVCFSKILQLFWITKRQQASIVWIWICTFFCSANFACQLIWFQILWFIRCV